MNMITKARRHDLDWLRVFLLVRFHFGMKLIKRSVSISSDAKLEGQKS